MSDTTVSTLPSGLWTQPAITMPDLGDAEPIQRIRNFASLTYDYTPGMAPTRFLRGLAERKLFGERCPVTGDVYIPPRGMSPSVGLPTTEQVLVGPNGSVAAFCIVHIGFGFNAPPTPFVSALVLMDGASVSVYSTILEIAHDQVRTGMRVEPVWAEELTASFESITHFRPIDEPDVPADDLRGHL